MGKRHLRIASIYGILTLCCIAFSLPGYGRERWMLHLQQALPVDSTAIFIVERNVRISLPHALDGQALYLLFYGDNPDFSSGRATLLGATQRSFYVDPLSLPRFEHKFYRALEFPAGMGLPIDEVMIEDFEDGLVTLTSYPGQDLQPDRWEINSVMTYDSSLFSLLLYGNTWKIEAIAPVTVNTGTVWRAAVATTDVGEIQAFGVGDGDHELFYVFNGTQQQTAMQWNTTYQNVVALNNWALIQMPIGRDWKIRYNEYPVIDRLFYVNDIDAAMGTSTSFFDEIHDITEDLPNVPQVFITAQGDSSALQPFYQFTSLVIDPDSPAHTYFWDFGDSTFSDEPNPNHLYASRGYRTVSLIVMDDDSLFGDAAIHLYPPPGVPLPEFTLNAAGDVMLARRYEEAGGIIPTYGVNYIFEKTRAMFGLAADISMVNLECPLTNQGYPHPTKDYIFRGNPANVAGLVYAGFDYVALGNNHTTDYMEPGLAQTIAVLDSAGLLFSGSGLNEYWATRPAFFTVDGIRVAVLSYCNRDGREDFLPPFLEAGYNKAGFAMFDEPTLAATIPAVDSLADLVIVQVHAGTEYDPSPLLVGLPPSAAQLPKEEFIRYDYADVDSIDRILKKRAVELGADLVLCHHPHVIQGFEVYQNKLIAHSFGNFAFDQNYWETYLSFILYTHGSLNGFDSFTFRPVYIDDYIPTPATGELAEAILRKLASYSRELGTAVTYDSSTGLGKIALSPAQVQESHRDISAVVSFRQEGSYYISEPLRVEDPGFFSAIVSISGIPGGAQLRASFGREILYMGGFEFEGGWLWNNNSPDVFMEPMYPHSGTYCLAVRRSSGNPPLWGDLEDRIPVNSNRRYTLDGYMAGINAKSARFGAAFYWSRAASGTFIEEQAVGQQTGTFPWTHSYLNLSTPNNGYFINVLCRNEAPTTGTGTAKFDDLKLIEWLTNWTTISTGFTAVDYPSETTFIQLRSNQAVSQAVITYRMTTREILPAGYSTVGNRSRTKL